MKRKCVHKNVTPLLTPVALALSVILFPVGHAYCAALNVDGTTITTTTEEIYTNTSVAPAINVTNGGKLTIEHSTTAVTNAPIARSVKMTGALSEIVIDAPLNISLGNMPNTVGLDLNAGTFTVRNGSIIITSTANSVNGTGPIGINVTNGANVNLGKNAVISLGTVGSLLPYTYGIRIATGASSARDSRVTAEDLQITTHGKNSAAIMVWNAVAALGSSATKNGEVFLTGTNNIITTSGEDSGGLVTGLTTHGKSRIQVGDSNTASSVSIVTTGKNSSGIYATTNGEIALFGDNQSIVTSGESAYGFTTEGDRILARTTDTSPQISLTGDNYLIETSGDYAHAIFANKGGDITLTNSAAGNNKIAASGIGAHAIYASGQRRASDTAATITLTQKGGSISSAQGDLFRAEGATITAQLENANLSAPGGKLIHSGIVPASGMSGTDGTIGSNVTLHATDNSTLAGDIYADGLSTANLTLSASEWAGSAENGSVDVDADSRWTMTGSSRLIDSVNNGAISFGDDPGAALLPRAWRTLTVDNNLSGNGRFIMRVNMAQQIGDKLLVAGTSAGLHSLLLTGDATQPTNGRERLTVVETQDGLATFTLHNSQTVDFGGYSYELTRTDNNHDWELKGYSGSNSGGDNTGGGNTGGNNSGGDNTGGNTGGNNGGGGNTGGNTGGNDTGGKTLSSAADAAANALIGNYLLSYAENQTLLQRMGELRLNQTEGDVWARGYAGRFDSFAKSYLSGFNMNYHGFQLGADKHIATATGSVLIGAMFGAANSSQSYARNGGDGSINSQSAGLYASYLIDNGLYIDGLMKYSRLTNSFKVIDSSHNGVSGESKSNSFSLSLESGKRFWLNAPQNGFYIEPQTQLSWIWQEGISTTASNGLRIKSDDINSVQGRIGSLVGYSLSGNSAVDVYYKTAFVGEMAGKIDYRLNGSRENEKMHGGWWNNGVGISAQVAERHTFYMDAEISTGHQFNQRQMNAGYRYSF